MYEPVDRNPYGAAYRWGSDDRPASWIEVPAVSDHEPTLYSFQVEAQGSHGIDMRYVEATSWHSDTDGWTKFYTSRSYLPSGSDSHHTAIRTDRLLAVIQLCALPDQHLTPPDAQ